MGRPDDASARHRAALELATDLGDRQEQARAHDGLADALDDPDHRDRAARIYADLGVTSPA